MLFLKMFALRLSCFSGPVHACSSHSICSFAHYSCITTCPLMELYILVHCKIFLCAVRSWTLFSKYWDPHFCLSVCTRSTGYTYFPIGTKLGRETPKPTGMISIAFRYLRLCLTFVTYIFIWCVTCHWNASMDKANAIENTTLKSVI